MKVALKEEIKGKILYNEPMWKHTSFRIGGPSDVWIEPEGIDDLEKSIRLARDKDMSLFIIGGGTNLLVNDKGIRGMVLDMSSSRLKDISSIGNIIQASSSLTLAELISFSSKSSLSGVEFLIGIPGTLGGAIATNAGARDYRTTEKWHSVGDLIKEIKVMDYEGNTRTLTKEDLKFGYKKANLEDYLILDVKICLKKKQRDFITSSCREFLKRKKETQELRLPTAGCIFKNPDNFPKSAGELLDKCNLKGESVGGAEVSRKHANFIVNKGSARASDVTALMDIMKLRVKNKFGIELSPEIKIV